MQSSAQMDVLYLDFAKAFDSIPHKELLVKLSEYLGIYGSGSSHIYQKDNNAYAWTPAAQSCYLLSLGSPKDPY